MNYVYFIYYLFHVAGNTLILEIDIVRDASLVIDDAVISVKLVPLPLNEVAFTVPTTSNGYAGFVVPIPTLPAL
jgi:hypothetical protein